MSRIRDLLEGAWKVLSAWLKTLASNLNNLVSRKEVK